MLKIKCVCKAWQTVPQIQINTQSFRQADPSLPSLILHLSNGITNSLQLGAEVYHLPLPTLCVPLVSSLPATQLAAGLSPEPQQG